MDNTQCVRSTILGVLFLLMACLLAGCLGSAPVKAENGPPAWVVRGSGAFHDAGKKYFYGVGAISGIANKPIAITAVDNRARAEIAKIFKSYSTSLMKDYMSTNVGSVSSPGGRASDATSAGEQRIDQVITTFSSVALSGVMIVDRWTDPADGVLYSLARLDLETFKQGIEGTRDMRPEVVDHVKLKSDQAFNQMAKEIGG